MRFPKRDVIATGLVAGAGLLYVLWAVGSAPPGMSGTRASGIVILALGFAASASAVVPTFNQLLQGNKAYLAVTSLIGVIALIGGVQMLLTASDTGLGIVMAAMVVLWLITTVHHGLLAKAGSPSRMANATQAPRHGW